LKIDPFLFRKKYNKIHYGFTFFYKKANLMFFSVFQDVFYALLGQSTLFFSAFAYIQVVGYPVFAQ
jgi:hypothetical protein